MIATRPVFQFCDANGAAVPAPLGGNAWQIRTIVVNMQVGVQNTAPGIWQTGAIQVTISDRIRLRNR